MHKMRKITSMKIFCLTILTLSSLMPSYSQPFMENIYGRKSLSLNGKWNAIFDMQNKMRNIWQDRKPVNKQDFVEYSFDNSMILDVPGDFNSQNSIFTIYEGTVWYKKTFQSQKNSKRKFMHFSGVNYFADIYVNNIYLGSHEGGFTPFQFEITDFIVNGTNSLIVKTNNERIKNGIPALSFDWLNYGGILRDVTLIETNTLYIKDYFIQLSNKNRKLIVGKIKINDPIQNHKCRISIPEAKIDKTFYTDSDGIIYFQIPVNLTLWSPSNPKLYDVIISCETDTIQDRIGFRTIETQSQSILLNGNPIFIKGISFHEEIPQRKGRAYSEGDAMMLLGWAKELGCNFVRLAHYPQNEHIVRKAEEMGFMVWEEIPVWQHIDFKDSTMKRKVNQMLLEMVSRDKNRCGIICWSLSNETRKSESRDLALREMALYCRALDPTRLIASAFDEVELSGDTITISDTIVKVVDLVGINKYMGWYQPWPSKPGKITWVNPHNKPFLISEFGSEALQGNHGPSDVASSWSEEYQEQNYIDNIEMFKSIPNLCGVCPWILADFQAPGRLLPLKQDGWNRKGIISDRGIKKKAWYVMKKYYSEIK